LTSAPWRRCWRSAVEVILHAGRQDVAILRRAWSTELNNLFDTQLAAGFAASPRSQVRQPDRLDPGRAGRQDGQLHALGRPAADRRATQLRRPRTWCTCCSWPMSCSAACRKQAGWSGPGGVPALESAPTSATRRRFWERLPRVAQLDTRSGPWPGGWPPGASAPPRRRPPVGSVLQDAPLVEIANAIPRTCGAGPDPRLHQSVLRRRADGILSAIRQGLEGSADPREPAGTGRSPNDSPLSRWPKRCSEPAMEAGWLTS